VLINSVFSSVSSDSNSVSTVFLPLRVHVGLHVGDIFQGICFLLVFQKVQWTDSICQ